MSQHIDILREAADKASRFGTAAAGQTMDVTIAQGESRDLARAIRKTIRQVAALTADKERLQRQLDAAKAGLAHYADRESWNKSTPLDRREESDPSDWYVVGDNGYDLAASTLEAIEQENK